MNEVFGVKEDFEFCDVGHLSDKYTSSGKCVECCKEHIKTQVEERQALVEKNKVRALRKQKKLDNQINKLEAINAVRTYNHHIRRSEFSSEGKGHGEYFTHEEVVGVYENQQGECIGCFASFDEVPFEVDHVQPLMFGGSNLINNIQLLCKSCNVSKGNRHNDDWLSNTRYYQVIDYLQSLQEEDTLVNSL